MPRLFTEAHNPKQIVWVPAATSLSFPFPHLFYIFEILWMVLILCSNTFGHLIMISVEKYLVGMVKRVCCSCKREWPLGEIWKKKKKTVFFLQVAGSVITLLLCFCMLQNCCITAMLLFWIFQPLPPFAGFSSPSLLGEIYLDKTGHKHTEILISASYLTAN